MEDAPHQNKEVKNAMSVGIFFAEHIQGGADGIGNPAQNEEVKTKGVHPMKKGGKTQGDTPTEGKVTDVRKQAETVEVKGV